jgi:hypothetical protein
MRYTLYSIRLLTILSLSTVFFASNAQETAKLTKTDSSSQLKTLFQVKKGNGLKSWGISASPMVQFGQLGTQSGMNFAFHVNNKWAIGAGFLGSSRRREDPNSTTVPEPRQRFSGLTLEYTPKANSLIHVSFPLMIGTIRQENPDMMYITAMPSSLPYGPQPGGKGGRMGHDRDGLFGDFRGPKAFGIQPGINLEMNVFTYGKLFAGVNYRAAFGENVTSEMKGFSGQIGMKFGLFDKAFKVHTKKKN